MQTTNVSKAGEKSSKHLTLDDIWHLADKGFLASAKWVRVIEAIRDDASWRLWAYRIIYAIGVAHILAGIIFFFAYNWADLTKEIKFALLYLGIVTSFVLWWISGPDSQIGKSAGIGATVLTGVLMAVFGQIYQTGADAHDLFVAWAVLTLPWAIISKSPMHLLVWALIANVAFALFSGQVMHQVWGVEEKYIMLLQAGLNALLLTALTFGARKSPFIMSQWLVGALVLGIIVSLTGASWSISDALFHKASPFIKSGLELIAVIALQVSAFWVFRRKMEDVFASTIALASLISTFVVLIMSLLERIVGSYNAFALLLTAIVVAGASALFIYLARSLAATMRGSDKQ